MPTRLCEGCGAPLPDGGVDWCAACVLGGPGARLAQRVAPETFRREVVEPMFEASRAEAERAGRRWQEFGGGE